MKLPGSEPAHETAGFTVSFSSQYISVVLIILTFVIGSFASQRLKESKVENIENSPPNIVFQTQAPKAESLVGELVYSDLFLPGDEKLNHERGQTIAQFLLAHDIKLVTNIPVEGLSQRPVNLTRFLVNAGVPAEALHIWGTAGVPTQEVRLKFLKEEG